MDRRWVADIMQNPEVEYEGKSYKYALVVVDIFSRYSWAALIDSPMTAAVGYREILRRAGKRPGLLLTDADPGFQTSEFKEALGSTFHELKAGKEDLSVVDRLIGSLKRKQKQAELDGQSSNWAQDLQKRVDGFNHTGAPSLRQSAPDDLRGPHGEIKNKALYFNKEWDESEGMQANAAAIHRRAEGLEKEGTAFRTLAPFPGPKRRAGDPVWQLKPHQVREVKGPIVVDQQGQGHLTKEVLPIPKESTELTTPAPKLNAKARGMLERYRVRAKAFLQGQPERRATATKLYNALAQEGDIKRALALAGVATDAVVRSFVRVFADDFVLETGKKGGTAHVALVSD
jgi:hypothetical protein